MLPIKVKQLFFYMTNEMCSDKKEIEKINETKMEKNRKKKTSKFTIFDFFYFMANCIIYIAVINLFFKI